MVSGKALSVSAYLAALPAARRRDIGAVRDVIRANLPVGYEESMGYGMITYAVPLSTLAETYNGQPLCYVALAAQKNHNALYLMSIYGDPNEADWFTRAYRATGKRMDVGKSCVRFRSLDDLPLTLIGQAVARTPIDVFIAAYMKSREKGGTRTRPRKKPAAKPTRP